MEDKLKNKVYNFAAAEITLGVIGSFLFFFATYVYLYYIGDYFINQLIPHVLNMLWPYIIMLAAGIGVSKLKLWAWYMNVYVLSLCFTGINVFYFVILLNPTKMSDWHPYVYFMIFNFLFIVIQIVFLARPSVKRLFTK